MNDRPMTGTRNLILSLHLCGRRPLSIAFYLVKRKVFPTLDAALAVVDRYHPRPDLTWLIHGVRRNG